MLRTSRKLPWAALELTPYKKEKKSVQLISETIESLSKSKDCRSLSISTISGFYKSSLSFSMTESNYWNIFQQTDGEILWVCWGLNAYPDGKREHWFANCERAVLAEVEHRPSHPIARSEQQLGKNLRKICRGSPAEDTSAWLRGNSPTNQLRRRHEKIAQS